MLTYSHAYILTYLHIHILTYLPTYILLLLRPPIATNESTPNQELSFATKRAPALGGSGAQAGPQSYLGLGSPLVYDCLAAEPYTMHSPEKVVPLTPVKGLHPNRPSQVEDRKQCCNRVHSPDPRTPERFTNAPNHIHSTAQRGGMAPWRLLLTYLHTYIPT